MWKRISRKTFYCCKILFYTPKKAHIRDRNQFNAIRERFYT